jgi:Tfp pilus assembly protein PilF
VAEEYLRLRIFDEAHDHFKSALTIDSRQGAAYEGLARLWRDAGFLELSLNDASRAVYFAPASAEAQNTLGTVLYGLGNVPEAQRRFELALSLDASAAYVHNNLCYLSFVRGDLLRARDQCTEALRLAPEFPAARANLAAVTAAAGK